MFFPPLQDQKTPIPFIINRAIVVFMDYECLYRLYLITILSIHKSRTTR